MGISKIAYSIAKKNPGLRKKMRETRARLNRSRFDKETRGIKTNPKTVLFCSYNGRSVACTPKAVYEYMISSPDFIDYNFIWVVDDSENFDALEDEARTMVVRLHSKEHSMALATAKYWFLNFRADDYITVKPDQVYVQCWHGTPLKRLGYDIEVNQNIMNTTEEIRDKYRTDAERFSYLLSPSPFTTEVFASAWNLKNTGMEEKIVEVGYPRDDFMFTFTEEDVKSTKEYLEIPDDKKVLLYAPTWRDNQHDSELGYVYENLVDFDLLREKLGEDWVILFRAHYLVANSFDFEKYEGFVYDVSSYNDVNDLYVISDALATDYSSVFFDYANLKRPIVFFMYDLDFYKDELRGFYLGTEELPGSIVKTTEEFADCILGLKDSFSYDEKYKAFNEKFNGLNDGGAAKRLVERVIEKEM